MTHPEPVAASVIIPVYNGANYITQQLDALAAQTGNPSFEVLICDNGSTDSTSTVVESYSAPYPLRVVDASQCAGASHARNMGAVQAAGDVLIFCDGDDLVEPDWVVSHLHVQNLYSPVIASGSLLHDRVNTPEVLQAYGLEPGDDQKTLSTRTRIFYDDELTPYAGFLPTVAGGNFSIPRRVYLEAGGMDSSYKSSEETDFAWRVQLAGVPAALTHGPLLHYILRDKPKRIFHQQRAYQKYKVLLWVHYRQHGMRGPSTKASILEVLRQAPKLINPTTRFRAAYLAGGNLGALEGILQYRILKRIPKPLRLDTAPITEE